MSNQSHTGNGVSTAQSVLEHLKHIATDAEALVRETADVVGERAKELRTRIAQSASKARAQLEELEETVVDKTRLAAKQTDDYVRDHPWESIGIGVAIGVVLGVLLTRR
jgi:ElaB/YqjD/DUF883 family membrane-anchored ribosome-binding protein